MIKMSIKAEFPDLDRVEHFLRYVRAFDATFPGCAFEMIAAGDVETADVAQMLENVNMPHVILKETKQ